MLKRKQTRKLRLDATTIKQLTDVTLGDVAGGISATCTEDQRCGLRTQGGTCTCNAPGCGY